MITYKGPPALALHALAWTMVKALWHTLADRTRRNPQAEVEPKLVGDASLAPRRIVSRHLTDEPLQLHWDRWSARARCTAPEPLPPVAPPPLKCLWLYHSQSRLPVEPLRQPDQGEAGGVAGALWLDVSFLVECQLCAQKEVFCGDRHRRTQTEPKAPRGIEDQSTEQTRTRPEMTDHA
jgi:hypothetical protein